MGVDFFFVGVVGFFDAFYRTSFESIPLFHQFVDAFRICFLRLGQTLEVFGLRNGNRALLTPGRLELLPPARSFLLGD